MSDLKETRLSTEQIYKGVLLNVWRDEVRLPNNRTSVREYIKHPGAVVLIPVLPDNRIIFVRQFRYPMKREFIELPAGKLDPGESPDQTGARELEEETGYKAGSLEQLAEIHPCIGYSDEEMWLYLATDLEKTAVSPDYDEFLDVALMTPEEALNHVWNGKITDVKTVIGIFWAQRIQMKP